MNTQVLLGIILGMITGLFGLFQFFKKQQAHIERLEGIVEVARRIHALDDVIMRRRRADPMGWATTLEGKGLVAKRVDLHEEYCAYTGSYPIREIEYMNELMDASSRS
jgi:hypothetical protein